MSCVDDGLLAVDDQGSPVRVKRYANFKNYVPLAACGGHENELRLFQPLLWFFGGLQSSWIATADELQLTSKLPFDISDVVLFTLENTADSIEACI